MSVAENRAVFLSYASQDAAAAERIASALRTAGVEVWFDKNELVGGDAWDQKIRRQIKECALFVPVISANTDARAEGYFRLEWKLAVDRSHLMSDDHPFLLPVVIDDTPDASARVPDRFRDVQWIRLNVKDTPESLAARVAKLLGSAGGTGIARAAPHREDHPKKNPWAWLGYAWAVVGLVVGMLYATRPFWGAARARERTSADQRPTASPAPMAKGFPRDPELRRAWDLFLTAGNTTPEDFALAEDIVKAAAARHPTDPEVTIVYAWLNDAYLNRGFDLSEERYVLGRRYAERAVQLAPDDPEAIAALGQFLAFRRADLPRAEQLLRRAMELNPREPRFPRALAWNVLRFGRLNEALAIDEQAAKLFPKDPLIQYELGLLYRDLGRLEDMEQAYNRCLALAPLGAAMINQAWIACWGHGDIAGMKRWIEQLPASQRLTDRALVLRYQYACLTRDPAELEDAQRALQALPGASMRDFWFTGPKALLLGDLFAAQGKPELAKAQYEVALAEIARQRAAAPADGDVLAIEMCALIGLGRTNEASATLRLLLSLSPNLPPGNLRWWFNPIPAALLLGDRADALQIIRNAVQDRSVRAQMRNAFRIDPRVAAFRTDPEINALLAEPR